MIPARELYNAIPSLVAADTEIGVDSKVVPIIAPFASSPNLVVGDLTLGIDDLAPVSCADAPSEGINPITGQWNILLDPPAGGFIWVLAGTTPALPITIYGFAHLNAAGSVLLGTYQLDLPIVVSVPMTILEFTEARYSMLVPPFV